ncbi:MAG: NAD(P)-binding protein, partial [Synergistaceae bacterium]|nr:NAD(P)-binding protein [Synergistaceae bacterium]
MYDYLIVGAGLTGSIIAHELRKKSHSVLVIDKRNHIAGNIYTENIIGIPAHVYGPHIFHTNSPKAWEYVSKFTSFNRFTNCPVANYKGEIYSLPFSMWTFNKMWGVTTPEQARAKIESQVRE